MSPGADEVVVPIFDDDTYPRLLRTARSRWWRPALGLFIAAVTVVLAAVAVILVALLVSWLTGGQGDPTAQDADTPLGLLANNLVIATMIPAAVLAVLVAHRDRPGWLASVTGRLRWGLLWRLLPIGLLVVLVSFGLGFLLPTSNDTSTSVPSVGTLITLLAVIVVSTPLQAAAEEVGFRGYLTQAVSSWFARPAVGVLVGRLAFGLVACWLAWRTGGLEASIALHAANNLVSLTFTAATGSLADSLTASTLEWQFAALDLVMMLTYAVLVDRLSRRWRPVTRRVLSPAAGVGYPGSRPITSPPARG
jgi:membrane protease YdiL (CAAX protease family)